MNIQWVSGRSDSITWTILEALSGGPMDTPSEYSVGIRPIRQYYLDNIGCTIRLTNRYTEWLFREYPADLTVSSRQYWMDCQADQWIRPMKLSVDIRLIRQYHPDNIGWTVRQTNGYTQWIFSGYLADPTLSSRQYWMDCQADQSIHPVNIQWVSG